MFIIHIHNLPEVTASPVTVEDTQIPECPYRGLFTFRPEHAHFFFGRETFTRQLVEAVKNRPFVTVLGASGSGKSSVVFAGLVPTLLNQTGESWLFTTFRPGDNPFLGLANALVPLLAPELSKIKQIGEARDLATRLRKSSSPLSDYINSIHQTHPDKRLLIIVDQFEELYTLGDDLAGRQQFLDMLLDLIKAVQGASPRIVLTLRADFLSQASLYRPFADILQGTTELLGPMTRAEMTDAIAKPAALQAVSFEPKLIDTILDDVGEEGNLPLLEFALTELWQHQRQRTLTHVAYVEIGEIKGALSRRADKAYQRFTPTEQEQARQVFVQLVNPGKGTGDTRRLATRSELENNWPLVTKLANERLVMTNQVKGKQDTVEVVHEALIRHWGLLRSWMAEARTFRSWQERLRFSMEEWQTNKDVITLLRGAPLAEAEIWLIKRPGDLSAAEKSYINASLDQRHQREKRRKLIFVSTVIVAILMAGLAILSFTQFQAANTERNKAATSEAIAVSQKATAEAAGTVIAHQNDAIKAELEFYQTADLQTQINYLATLLERPGYESQATKLFWGLPTQKSRRDLFRVKDDRVVKVIKGLSVTLADVNRTGYADPILSGMIEALVTSGQAPELKTELEAWLQARRITRDIPDWVALTTYDRLILLNDRNPAYFYERATVQVELADYQAALADLEQVMSLVNNPVFVTRGLVDSRADFATVQQVTRAVRQLIRVTPDLGRLLNNSASSFPHLQQFDLVLAPTPTPVTNNIDGASMVLVPAGPFKMGSNYGESNEQPVHEVTLNAFYIDQYEITNALYRQCVMAGVCEKPACVEGTVQTYDDKSKQNHPVACVSWPQAKTYCE